MVLGSIGLNSLELYTSINNLIYIYQLGLEEVIRGGEIKADDKYTPCSSNLHDGIKNKFLKNKK